MRQSVLLALDVCLTLLATTFAFVLREDFELETRSVVAFLPYVVATVIASAAVFPATGLNRTFWRFTTLQDHLRVTAAVGGTVAVAVVLAWGFNRLEGASKSLPFLQFLAGIAFLTTPRALYRLHHQARLYRKLSAARLAMAGEDSTLTVLIAGISLLTETYLQAIGELGAGQIKVAGLLAQKNRHVGRLLAAHPVLGVPEDVEQVLERLELQGVSIRRIVLACPFEQLTPAAQNALLGAERSQKNLAPVFGAGSWVLWCNVRYRQRRACKKWL